MPKGQLARDADCAQQSIEDKLALLGSALARLEHDALRVRQAIRRAGLDDLLDPVLDDYAVIQRQIKQVQESLRDTWEHGQARRWG